ncbi:MFS transporter [Nocardia halotolerans]|uniref:MFS transporter n=1 Tax=Nocardia halotolerans TaxID=1755878 RepID=A0ABV8VM24_9NOCA
MVQLNEVQDSDTVVPSRLRRNLILVVMCSALVAVMGIMASLMVAVPEMAADLRATESQLLWILNAYGIAFAGLLMVAGALGDRYGRKAMLVVGLVIFGASSAAVLIFDDIDTIIGLRALAGVGAAAVMPTTLSIITHVFPPDERGRAVGVWSGVAVGGALIGLLTAGGLLEWFSWRSIFAFNVALTVVTLVATVLVPRQSKSGRERVDVGGGLLSVLAVAALVFGMIEGPERGWSSVPVVSAFVLAVIGTAGFIGWELRHPRPLLDPRLFRQPGLASGSIVITAESLAMFGFFIVGLQYLQIVKGYSPLEAALSMLPLALAAMVFSPLVPVLHRKWGYWPVVILGMSFIATGLAIMSVAGAESSYLPIGFGVFLLGSGIAFAATPATEALMAALPPEKHGVASALNDVTRELGAVLGIAVLGTVFSSVYRDSVADSAAQLPSDIAHRVEASVAEGVAIGSAPGAPPGLLDSVYDSFRTGMSAALISGIVVVALGTVAAWVSGRGRAVRSTESPGGTVT